jgi:hypothetical protein
VGSVSESVVELLWEDTLGLKLDLQWVYRLDLVKGEVLWLERELLLVPGSDVGLDAGLGVELDEV